MLACQPAERAAAPAPRPVAVLTDRVVQRDVNTYLTGLGTVAAYQTVTVRPVVEGRLAKVLFVEGQEVHQGDELATLDLRPFEIAVHNAQGALQRDRATLKNAQLNLKRNEGLLHDNLVSEQAVTDQRALVAQSAGTVAVDEAALAQAAYQLEQAHIVSPIDGVTGVRGIDAGNPIHTADVGGLVVVTQVQPISVLFTLPENARAHVASQMRQGPVTAAAFTRDADTPLGAGKVQVVDNQMGAGSGTVRLKAVLENPNHTLWPGQFVKVRIQLDTLPNAQVVPQGAVQRGPDGDFVYVVTAEDTAEQRPIERLQLTEGVSADGNDDTVLVAKGLTPGEEVVVDGQLRLRPGSKVARQPQTHAASAGSTAAQAGPSP